MATNLDKLAEALAHLDGAFGGAKPVQPVTREQYQAARADLEARARAGETVQGRNSKGHFTRGVKMFTAGVAPVAPVVARKVEKVVEVRPARHVDRTAPAHSIAAE